MSRPPRASASAASTTRSTFRSAAPPTRRIFGPFQSEPTMTKRCGTTKRASNIRRAPITFNGRSSTPRSRTCRSRSMRAAARRASCSTSTRRTRPASRWNSPLSPLQGLDLSLAGSYVSAEFDSTRATNAVLATPDRHPRRQPPAVGAEVPGGGDGDLRRSGSATMPTGTSTASFQHVGSRYTQPATRKRQPAYFEHDLLRSDTGDSARATQRLSTR